MQKLVLNNQPSKPNIWLDFNQHLPKKTPTHQYHYDYNGLQDTEVDWFWVDCEEYNLINGYALSSFWNTEGQKDVSFYIKCVLVCTVCVYMNAS